MSRHTLLLFFKTAVMAGLLLLMLEQGWAALPLTQNKEGLPSLAPVLRGVTPAVVNISVLTRAPVESNPLFADPFFRRFFDLPEHRRAQPKRSAGSGVIVDAREGYVLTNHHVIENADKILVRLKDRRTMEAELVGTDPETDIALLKIPANGLTAIPFGDSGLLEVGDFVVAIGNPFGLGQTVTSGIISALRRSGLDIEGYEDFIQTDASINPGNSGGPLLNLKGEIIGINTAIIGPNGGNVGIGFAVPSNMARTVMRHLVRHGGVRRGQLGVAAQDLTPEIAEALGVDVVQGAVISQVDPNSAAEEAGLRIGDVVVAIDGRPIDDSADLRNAVGLVAIGDAVKLTLLRGGKTKSVTARLAEPTNAVAAEQSGLPLLAGSYLRDFRQSTASGPIGGVLIGDVRRDSQSWRFGLRPGDIILGVNRQRIDSISELRTALEKAGRVLALTVQRDDNRLLIVIE